MVEGTAQRLDELQRLSEQADKGEWFVASRDNDDEGWWIWTTDQYDAPYTLALAAYDGGFENDGQRIERDEANTQFVAALVNAYRAGDLVSSESLRGQADALQAAQLERDSAMASLARGEAIHAEALAGWSTTEAALQAATDERDRLQSDNRALRTTVDETLREAEAEVAAAEAKWQELDHYITVCGCARSGPLPGSDHERAVAVEAALQRVRALVERWDAASSGASRERAFINKLRNAALGVGAPTESEPTILDDLDRARHLVRHEPFPYQPNPGPLLPVPENPTTETER